MNTTKMKRGLSCLTVLLLLLTMFVGMPVQPAQAANEVISVKIANVSRRYNEANMLLGKINEYRIENGKTKLVMDTTYLENAMIRAAELSLYYDAYTSPNGKAGSRYITNVNSGGQLVGYDVRSLDALLNDFKSNAINDSHLLNSTYQSVGVGLVSVNGYKFVCVLMSAKTVSPVADSVLAQSSVVLEQEVETLPEHLTEMTSPYSAGYSVNCGGGSLAAYVRVKNKGYPTADVILTPYHATVNLSNPNAFEFRNDRVYAIAPGICTMTITFAGVGKSASCQLKAVGKSLGDCSMDAIPDQIYTGKAITPKVTIRDADGNTLVRGTDYTVTYADNVNVGVATVTITGKGLYEGETKKLYFKIILGGDNPTDSLSINISVSESTIALGQGVTIKVVPTGGNAPIKYTYSACIYGQDAWTTISANTTSTSCVFKPKEANRYLIKVSASDSKGLTAQQATMIMVKAVLTVKAEITPETPIANGTVTVKATSTGGATPIQYAFYLQKPNSSGWITLHDYSATKEVSFKPANEGTYQICVKAKSNTDELVKQYYTIKVTASTLMNSSTVSATEIDLGLSVTLKGVGSKGTSPYTYSYHYKKASESNWHTIKDYSTSNTATLKPSSATTYNLCIKVKDATDRVEKRYIDVVVYPKLVNSSTLSASSIALGKSVTLKGVAKGGKGPYQYSYWYRAANTSTFSKIKDFSTTQSVSYTPKTVGRSYFRIKVKDSTGQILSLDLFVDVTSTLANKSTISATSVTAGKTVTIKCSASGGTAPYQYAVYYCKPGSTAYIRSSDYTDTTTTRTVKLTAKGTYKVLVKVKDSVGLTIKKEFTVQST